MTLSSVQFWYAVWRLSVVHNRAIDHRVYAESRNARTSRSLFLPPPPPPSLFSHAWKLHRRAIVSLSSTRLSTICCRGLIIGLKYLSNAMSFSILPVFLESAVFFTDRFARFLDLPYNFFTLAHISHVRFWRSIDND